MSQFANDLQKAGFESFDLLASSLIYPIQDSSFFGRKSHLCNYC